MKKNQVKIRAGCGIFCIAAVLLSGWYAVTFNDSRLVVPMDFGSYSFHLKDLPMDFVHLAQVNSPLGACPGNLRDWQTFRRAYRLRDMPQGDLDIPLARPVVMIPVYYN